MTSWFQNQVHELRFTQPQTGTYGSADWSTGMEGDIVVLKKDDCTGVHNSSTTTDYAFSRTYGPPTPTPTPTGTGLARHPDDSVTLAITYSKKFTLEAAGGEAVGDEKGGTALVKSLAMGKVNELGVGIYKICYATKSSEGEEQGDFVQLTKTLEILPSTATKPDLTVPRVVQLGADIVVSWSSTIQLQNRRSKSNSWLGLFTKGECNVDTEERNQCYKAWQFINVNENTGTVIFSQKDYKFSGEYEVRFFQGDTRNGQGTVCRGQESVATESYVHCVLEAAATSNTITVAGSDINEIEDLSQSSVPGIEAVFGSANKGRYYRKALN